MPREFETFQDAQGRITVRVKGSGNVVYGPQPKAAPAGPVRPKNPNPLGIYGPGEGTGPLRYSMEEIDYWQNEFAKQGRKIDPNWLNMQYGLLYDYYMARPQDSYWEEPATLARWAIMDQNLPKETPRPQWMNSEMLQALYGYFSEKNSGRPWYEWDKLPADDPIRIQLQKLPIPDSYDLPDWQKKAQLQYGQGIPPAIMEALTKFPSPASMAPRELSEEQRSQFRLFAQELEQPAPEAGVGGLTGLGPKGNYIPKSAWDQMDEAQRSQFVVLSPWARGFDENNQSIDMVSAIPKSTWEGMDFGKKLEFLAWDATSPYSPILQALGAGLGIGTTFGLGQGVVNAVRGGITRGALTSAAKATLMSGLKGGVQSLIVGGLLTLMQQYRPITGLTQSIFGVNLNDWIASQERAAQSVGLRIVKGMSIEDALMELWNVPVNIVQEVFGGAFMEASDVRRQLAGAAPDFATFEQVVPPSERDTPEKRRKQYEYWVQARQTATRAFYMTNPLANMVTRGVEVTEPGFNTVTQWSAPYPDMSPTEYVLDMIAVDLYKKMARGEPIAPPEMIYQPVLEKLFGVPGQAMNLFGQIVLDPIDLIPKANARVIGVVAEATKNKVLRDIMFQKEVTPIAGLKTYRDTLRIMPAHEIIENFGWLERKFAGIDKTGLRTDLNTVQKGNVIGNLAARFYGLTPEARVINVIRAAYEGIARMLDHQRTSANATPQDLTAFYDAIKSYTPEQIVRMAGGASKLTIPTAVGGKVIDAALAQYITSPEMQPVLISLKDQEPTVRALLSAWETARPDRELIAQAAQKLRMKDLELIAGLLKQDAGTQSLVDQAKAAGVVDADRLVSAAATFYDPKTKNRTTAYSVIEFQTDMALALSEGAEKWAIRHYGVKEMSFLRKLETVMKNAQGILLFDLNPKYAIDNAVNNIITMAWDGLLGGFRLGRRSDEFLERFGRPNFTEMGLTPAEFGSGYSSEAAFKFGLGNVAGKTPGLGELLRQTMAGEGRASMLNAKIGALRSKIGLFSRLSQWAERRTSAIAVETALREHMALTWKPSDGRTLGGYRKMEPDLRRMLNRIRPGLAEKIENAPMRGLNTREIEALIFDHWGEPSLHDVLTSQEYNLLAKFPDVLGQLEEDLKKSGGPQDVIAAIERAGQSFRQNAQEMIVNMSRDAAKLIAQELHIEGSVIKLGDRLDRLVANRIDFWVRYMDAMGEVADRAAEARARGDYISVDRIYRAARTEWDWNWRNFELLEYSQYRGIFEGLELGTRSADNPEDAPFIRFGELHRAMSAAHSIFFNTKSDELEFFFAAARGGQMPEAELSQLWEATNQRISDAYLEMMQTEEATMGEMDAYMVVAFEQRYPGRGMEVATWRTAISDVRRRMMLAEAYYRTGIVPQGLQTEWGITLADEVIAQIDAMTGRRAEWQIPFNQRRAIQTTYAEFRRAFVDQDMLNASHAYSPRLEEDGNPAHALGQPVEEPPVEGRPPRWQVDQARAQLLMARAMQLMGAPGKLQVTPEALQAMAAAIQTMPQHIDPNTGIPNNFDYSQPNPVAIIRLKELYWPHPSIVIERTQALAEQIRALGLVPYQYDGKWKKGYLIVSVPDMETASRLATLGVPYGVGHSASAAWFSLEQYGKPPPAEGEAPPLPPDRTAMGNEVRRIAYRQAGIATDRGDTHLLNFVNKYLGIMANSAEDLTPAMMLAAIREKARRREALPEAYDHNITLSGNIDQQFSYLRQKYPDQDLSHDIKQFLLDFYADEEFAEYAWKEFDRTTRGLAEDLGVSIDDLRRKIMFGVGGSGLDTRNSLSQFDSAMMRSAIETYGVTEQAVRAGFILPDGQMLDLARDRSSTAVDHRDAALRILRDSGSQVDNAYDAITAVARQAGLLRVDFQVNFRGEAIVYVDARIIPTRAQLSTIAYQIETSPYERVILQYDRPFRQTDTMIGRRLRDFGAQGAYGMRIMNKGSAYDDLLEIFRGGEGALYQGYDPHAAPPWYYHQAIDLAKTKLPRRASVEQIKNMFKSNAKTEEIESTGVMAWLDRQQGLVKVEDLIDYLNISSIEIHEVLRGPMPRDYAAQTGQPEMRTKFDVVNLTGGTNVREIVMTYAPGQERIGADVPDELPPGYRYANPGERVVFSFERTPVVAGSGNPGTAFVVIDEVHNIGVARSDSRQAALYNTWTEVGWRRYRDFYSHHWDEINILAHVRFDERRDASGRKILMITEVQSDLHQDARHRRKQEIDRLVYTTIQSIEENPDNPRPVGAEERAQIEREVSDKVPLDFGYVKGAIAADELPAWTKVDVIDNTGSAKWLTGELRSRVNNKLLASFDVDRDWPPEKIRLEALRVYNKNETTKRIPDAPLKKGWKTMAIKRMLAWAAANDFDAIAWPSGTLASEIENHMLLPVTEELWTYPDEDVVYVRKTSGAVEAYQIPEGLELRNYIGFDGTTQLLKPENTRYITTDARVDREPDGTWSVSHGNLKLKDRFETELEASLAAESPYYQFRTPRGAMGAINEAYANALLRTHGTHGGVPFSELVRVDPPVKPIQHMMTRDYNFAGENFGWFYDKELLNEVNYFLGKLGLKDQNGQKVQVHTRDVTLPIEQYTPVEITADEARDIISNPPRNAPQVALALRKRPMTRYPIGSLREIEGAYRVLQAHNNDPQYEPIFTRLEGHQAVVHGIDIGPELKAEALKGFSLFSGTTNLRYGATFWDNQGMAHIRLFKNAYKYRNFTTWHHEFFHALFPILPDKYIKVFERYLAEHHGIRNLPQGWQYGIQFSEAKEIITDVDERYLREGHHRLSLSQEMLRVLDGIKKYFVRMYQNIVGSRLDKPLPEYMVEVFDRIHGEAEDPLDTLQPDRQPDTPFSPEVSPEGRIMASEGAVALIPEDVDFARRYVRDVYAHGGQTLSDEEVEAELVRLGWGTVDDIHASNEAKMQMYVEDGVRDLTRMIISEGGMPYSSNFYGPMDKGVWWRDASGQDHFTGASNPREIDIDSLSQVSDPPAWFYSHLYNVILQKVPRETSAKELWTETEVPETRKDEATGQRIPTGKMVVQYGGILAVNGVKREEMVYTGLLDWLAEQTGRIKKDALDQFMQTNQVRVEDYVFDNTLNREKLMEDVRAQYPDYDTKVQRLESLGYTYELDDVNYTNYSTAKLVNISTGEKTLMSKAYWLPAEVADLASEIIRSVTRMIYNNSNTYIKALHYPTYFPSRGQGRGVPGTKREFLIKWVRAYPDNFQDGFNTAFTHGHFNGQKDFLVHFRCEDRVLDGIGKVLSIVEVQSDWHQIARENRHDFITTRLAKPMALYYHWFVPDSQRPEKYKGMNEDALAKAFDEIILHSSQVPDYFGYQIGVQGQERFRLVEEYNQLQMVLQHDNYPERQALHKFREDMRAKYHNYWWRDDMTPEEKEHEKVLDEADNSAREKFQQRVKEVQSEIYGYSQHTILPSMIGVKTLDRKTPGGNTQKRFIVYQNIDMGPELGILPAPIYNEDYYGYCHDGETGKKFALSTFNDYIRNVSMSYRTTPWAPFERTYDLLALKRIIAYAAQDRPEGNYQGIVFPSGPLAANAEHHAVVSNVSQIVYNKSTGDLEAYQPGARYAVEKFSGVRPEDLPAYVGPAVAKQILEQPRPDPKDFVIDSSYKGKYKSTLGLKRMRTMWQAKLNAFEQSYVWSPEIFQAWSSRDDYHYRRLIRWGWDPNVPYERKRFTDSMIEYIRNHPDEDPAWADYTRQARQYIEKVAYYTSEIDALENVQFIVLGPGGIRETHYSRSDAERSISRHIDHQVFSSDPTTTTVGAERMRWFYDKVFLSTITNYLKSKKAWYSNGQAPTLRTVRVNITETPDRYRVDLHRPGEDVVRISSYPTLLEAQGDINRLAQQNAWERGWLEIVVEEPGDTVKFDGYYLPLTPELVDDVNKNRQALFNQERYYDFAVPGKVPDIMPGTTGARLSMLLGGAFNELINVRLGERIKRVLEPFGGNAILGNAVQVALGKARVINDADTEIHNLHTLLKTQPEAVIEAVGREQARLWAVLKNNPGGEQAWRMVQDFYRDIRARLRRGSAVERAALTVITNSGDAVWANLSNGLRMQAELLAKDGVEIRQRQDPGQMLAEAGADDLVIIDPPMIEPDQMFLRNDPRDVRYAMQLISNQIAEAAARGVPIIYVNRSHPDILRALDKAKMRYRYLDVRSGKNDRRYIVAWSNTVGAPENGWGGDPRPEAIQTANPGRVDNLADRTGFERLPQEYASAGRSGPGEPLQMGAGQPPPGGAIPPGGQGTGPGGAIPPGRGGGPPVINAPLGTSESLSGPPLDSAGLMGYLNNVDPVLAKARDGLVSNARAANTVTGLNQTLPPEVMEKLRAWAGGVYADLADTKMSAIQHAKGRRDFALLDYTQRTGIDNLISTIFPYSFWYTHSMINWALRALEHPSIFANFLRLQHIMQSNQDDPNEPSRLEGKLEVPFLHDLFGGTLFVDPMRQTFPFYQMIRPFITFSQQQNRANKRAEQIIQRQLQEEKITSAQAEAAISQKGGDIWERAYQEALYETRSVTPGEIAAPWQPGESRDWVDLAFQVMSPSLPISFIYNQLITGRPWNALPIQRFVQNITSPFGVGGPRGFMLTRDKFDDYRDSRELANMAGEGKIDGKQAVQAMIERKGPIFDEAQRRAAKTLSVQYWLGTLAADLYPEGEKHNRELRDEYLKALKAKVIGLDAQAINEFYDKYPEYEARNATFDQPEPRLRQFLISQIWEKYYTLNGLNKAQAKEQLGEKFVNGFYNPDTRNYNNIDTPTLLFWSRSLGNTTPSSDLYGQPPDKPIQYVDKKVSSSYDQMQAEKARLFPSIDKLYDVYWKTKPTERKIMEMGKPEFKKHDIWKTAYLAEHPELIPYEVSENSKLYGAQPQVQAYVYQFWAARNKLFPDILDKQEEYFRKNKADARVYLAQHPELKEYWDWRKKMAANYPLAAPYILSAETLADMIVGNSGSSGGGGRSASRLRIPNNIRRTVLEHADNPGVPLALGIESETAKLMRQAGWTGTAEEFWRQLLPTMQTQEKPQTVQPVDLSKIPQELVRQLTAYKYNGTPLGAGALAQIEELRKKLEIPVDSEKFLQAYLLPAFQ